MQRYKRMPAIIVLALMAAVGGFYLTTWGRNSNGLSGDSMAKLQKIIASGKADAATWSEYGQRLAQAGEQANAALAYRKAIELDPSDRAARLGCVLALADVGRRDAKKADELYEFISDLKVADAKFAVDLLERRELAPYLAEGRFQSLQKDAIAQKMD